MLCLTGETMCHNDSTSMSAVLITRTGPMVDSSRMLLSTKKLIYCAAHLVATLPIMLGLGA